MDINALERGKQKEQSQPLEVNGLIIKEVEGDTSI